MRSLSLVAVCGLLVSLVGCYTYVPLTTPQAEPGSLVRATLAEPSDITLPDRTLRVVERVDGEVVGFQADTMIVWARAFATDEGVSRLSTGQPVPLLRSTVLRLETRQLSTTRTVAFFGLAAVALLLLDQGLESWGGGSGEGGGGIPQ